MTDLCPPGRHLSGYQHPTHKRRIRDRYPNLLLLLHAVAELACMLVAITCSPLTGTPQWVVTLALLLASLVIPMSAYHLLKGD